MGGGATKPSTTTPQPFTKPQQQLQQLNSKPLQKRRDELVGKVVEATILDIRCPSTEDNGDPQHHVNNEQSQMREESPSSLIDQSNVHQKATKAINQKQHQSKQRKYTKQKTSSSNTSTKQQPLSKKESNNISMSQKLSERFLCGASFGDLGDALKMAAAAGHHCDEDHVGLYVADTEDEEDGSSIATADVIGF